MRLHKIEKPRIGEEKTGREKGLKKKCKRQRGIKRRTKKKENNGKQMKQYGDKISAQSEKATWRSEQKIMKKIKKNTTEDQNQRSRTVERSH